MTMSYLKDKNSQDGLNALMNYLNAAADLDDYLGHQDTSNFSKLFSIFYKIWL